MLDIFEEPFNALNIDGFQLITDSGGFFFVRLGTVGIIVGCKCICHWFYLIIVADLFIPLYKSIRSGGGCQI